MNNHALTSENILSTFPQVLKNDPKLDALAASISGILAKRQEEIRRIAIYSRIDELPEDLLDILAYDFKIDWYDFNYPIAAKRELLKSCWSVHRRLGTKASVEKALSSVYPGSYVEEWFQYGGEPYRFRIICDITASGVTASWEDLIKAVQMYKRLSAYIDGLSYQTHVTCEVQTHTDYFIYKIPQAGTIPHRNAILGGCDTHIAAETASDRTTYLNIQAGQVKSGTIPNRVTSGSVMSDMLSLEVSSSSKKYTVPLAGNVTNQAECKAYHYNTRRCGSHKKL